MNNTDKEYWNSRYLSDQTGWDIGYISTPIKEYIDQLENKKLNILIPGCGNAWEGEYLISQGFEKTHLIDISEEAINNFQARVPQFPTHQITNSLLLRTDFEPAKGITKFDSKAITTHCLSSG